jgi:hypothetical protein
MTRKTYVMRDGQLIEKHLAMPEEVNAPFIQGDIQPHRNMVTGEIVTTRSRHRNILREHGLIEVGNETGYLKSKPVTTPPGLKEAIVREVKKHRGY